MATLNEKLTGSSISNVVHFTTMPHDGHFPAFEQPRLAGGHSCVFRFT